MELTLKDRTEVYSGQVFIRFGRNENVTVCLADGCTVDLFADGSWQVWTPRDGSVAPVMIGQGEFPAPPE